MQHVKVIKLQQYEKLLYIKFFLAVCESAEPRLIQHVLYSSYILNLLPTVCIVDTVPQKYQFLSK